MGLLNYGSWLNPPDQHEICECEDCHEAGEHEDKVLYWKKQCQLCVEEIGKKSKTVVMEFTFKAEDSDKALEWAKSNGIFYNRQHAVEHLMHDALIAGAIKPESWTPL